VRFLPQCKSAFKLVWKSISTDNRNYSRSLRCGNDYSRKNLYSAVLAVNVYCILSSIVRTFFKENYDEILFVHFTWKAPEKGFKIGKVMAKKWLQN
jgi:hypothetical protein